MKNALANGMSYISSPVLCARYHSMNQTVSYWSLGPNPPPFSGLGAIAPLAPSDYATGQRDGNFGVLPLRRLCEIFGEVEDFSYQRNSVGIFFSRRVTNV